MKKSLKINTNLAYYLKINKEFGEIKDLTRSDFKKIN